MFLKRLDAETERLCKIFMKDGENCLMFFKNKNKKNRKTNKKTIIKMIGDIFKQEKIK